jgi:hypothetical protein
MGVEIQSCAPEKSHIMRKRPIIIGLTLLWLTATGVTLYIFATFRVKPRPVRLVITAPEGQRFSGSYVADGVTNAVSALAPATISLRAKDVDFEFKREGGAAEFRVALFVDDSCRTSTASDKKNGVRGAVHYAAHEESYWAAPFD